MTFHAGLVNDKRAVELYARIPLALHAGTMHPLYVVADAKRDLNLSPRFWVYESAGEIYMHGFHLAKINGTDLYDLQSPYGYGGPIATTDASDFLEEADMQFRQWAINARVVAEFIRFHPMLENWKYYGGQSFFDRKVVWVDCNKSDLLMSYQIRQRTAIRKAVNANVEVKWLSQEDLKQVFPKFYVDAMRNIKADEFYLFSDDYFLALLSLPFISGVGALVDNEFIAMSLFLGDGVGEYHLSGKNMKGSKYAASSLLLHEAAQQMKKDGLKKLYLGGGSTSSTEDSLLFFKAGFSSDTADFKIGKRVFIPTAYEQLKQDYSAQYMQYPQRILFYRS
ncbi:MAG: hypothetical protein ACAH12_06300 [Methylophilaceae bacterium]